MLRFGTPLLALMFAACATAPDPATTSVEIAVAGPILAASETENPARFQTPSVPAGLSESFGADGILAQYWTMLGREDRSAALDQSEYDLAPCDSLPSAPVGYEAVLNQIVAQARETRIVLVNESHVNTVHRDFSRQLIGRLRQEGYTVFAAEAFANIDGAPDPVEANAALPYAKRGDGTYVAEPVFGGLIRAAKRLGYRLAAYEITRSPEPMQESDLAAQIAIREQAQAENLAAIVERLGPDEKLVAHVGYSHAREIEVSRADGLDASWMGARLKRLTGIDPLTIAQTKCRGSSSEIRLSEIPEENEGWFDLVVDHPAFGFRYGRPEWRFADGFTAVAIPKELTSQSHPVIVEAFVEGEPFDAVPADRAWVDPGEDVRLALRPGRYTVRAVRPTAESESQAKP